MTKTLVIMALSVGVAIVTYGIFQNQEQDPVALTIESPKPSAPTTTVIESSPSEERATVAQNEEVLAAKEVLQLLDHTDREFRELAMAEAERYMAEFDPERNVSLRWQPLRIDADDLLRGSFLDEGSMVEEFQISPFPFVSFKATQTRYSIDNFNNMARWYGVLDDGASGSIKIYYQMHEDGYTVFLIQMHMEDQDIAIMATDLRDVYVASEANPYGPIIAQ